LLLCLTLMGTVHVVARRSGFGMAAAQDRAAGLPRSRHLMIALRRAAPALLMPVLIVLGIRYGVFTPTEAGAVLVLIALAYGLFVYRQLQLEHVLTATRETIEATASLMLIVSFATAFAFYLTWEGIPQEILRFLLKHVSDPLAVLLILNVVLLVAGMFLDTVSAMIILVPIIHPIALRIGIDPVHIGLIVVLNLTIGGVTPPVGLLMYLSNAIIGCSVLEFTRAAWPFLLALLAVLGVVILWPEFSLFIPHALFR